MEKNIRLWGGRFEDEPNKIFQSLNSSIQMDKILWHQDIKGSTMYSKTLAEAGIITQNEANTIQEGLNCISDEWTNGSFIIHPSDEDIHTANERRLKELIGPIGGKLHTGRSRNDQVIVDMRMWVKDNLKDTSEHLIKLIKVLVERSEEYVDILFPGYTHLQRAQAIRFSHWMLSYAWFLYNDLQKLKFVFWSTDSCPLGSGAIAGNPFSINREELAENLNFSHVSQNSMLAVSDRDFVVEYLFWCSLTSCHLSRLSEDLILYSSSEFDFIKLSDEFTSGSSLMPQKKNPDSLELIRGKCGRAIGNLTGFLHVLKGLPSTYNKDLQEDKELLFNSIDTIQIVLQVMAGTIQTMKVQPEICSKALTEDMLATDVAYYLVRKGIPFREAHEKAGQVVKIGELNHYSLSQIPLEQLQKISSKFTDDIVNIWNFENSVEQYSATGGTSKSSVVTQIEKLKTNLGSYNLNSTTII